MSWPKLNAIMVEPTESESKEELDRFINAMILIRGEIDEIINGTFSQEDNVLKNSPHILNDIMKIRNYKWKKRFSQIH